MNYKHIMISAALALSAITPAFVAVEQVKASTISFSDVKQSDYFAPAVYSLAKRGIVSGYKGKFSPNRAVTRAEAVKMLYGILNTNAFPAVNPPSFVDVDKSHLFYREIAYLSELKIINGTGGVQPKFNPDAKITREEMAVMISRAFELEVPETDYAPFVDLREPYAMAIHKLYAHGLAEGISNTHFGSREYVTRGQIAVFLQRAEERELQYTESLHGKVQNVTSTYVQIDNKKYAIPGAYKMLFSTKNARALKDAEISFEANLQTIHSVEALNIEGQSSQKVPLVLTGDDDEDWREIDLFIRTPYVKLQDVDINIIEVHNESLELELNGHASDIYLFGFDRSDYLLKGTGTIERLNQGYLKNVDLQFNGLIEYFEFTTGNESLKIGNATEIELFATNYSLEQLEERVTGLENVYEIEYYDVEENGESSEEDDDLIDEDESIEKEDEEFLVDDAIVNPDFQGPFDGIIYAVEDGRMKVGKHWVTIEGELNKFFNENKEMLIGSPQQMRAFNNEVIAIQRLVIEKSGTVEFDYWNLYGLTVNALNIHADNVEVININATNSIYLSEEVKTKFTYKDGESTGEFVIAGEDEVQKSTVEAEDLVLSFENVVVDDLTILQPNRKIEMGRNVYLNNFTVNVPKNAAKRYPVISMDSVYEQLNFTTRFANVSSVSSFIMSELSPKPPIISGNAVIEELNVLKGTVDWQAKGMIHTLTSVKDNAVTIGPEVLIGATYDRFGDAVPGQFVVKNGTNHKAQLNVSLDDTAYFIPKMESQYLMYGQHHVFIMKPENLKVAYKFGTAEELETFQIGQQINLAGFASEKEYNSHMYWHDQELLVFALDGNNRILSKQLYTPLEVREEAFRFRRDGDDAYIESIATSSIASTHYVYYFVEGEMRSVNDPKEVKWLNDQEAVNRIQLPLATSRASEVSETVGFIITVNGEQQIHQLNNSRENNLRILPGLGRDLLENKSEGAKVMTAHILKGMYKGSLYVPKGFEYEFVLKQYMADFSEESNLTMERIGEIVVKHDQSETTLQYIRHIQGVRSQMNTIEARVQQMINEGRQSEAREVIEALYEQVELVREEALRTEYKNTLEQLQVSI